MSITKNDLFKVAARQNSLPVTVRDRKGFVYRQIIKMKIKIITIVIHHKTSSVSSESKIETTRVRYEYIEFVGGPQHYRVYIYKKK